MKKQQLSLVSSLVCSALAATPSLSHAAGFAIVEQNVSGLGNAYAGASSIANDASTVFYNPAGMTQLSGRHFSASIHSIKPSAKFTDSSSSVTTGGNGGDGGGTEIVPNIYYVTPVSDKTKFGIGINAPFGLSTEYDDGWKGRYQAVKSTVTTLNINPSIGFSTDTPFSFGLGINIQYMDAKLTNALDFGAICYGATQVAGSPLTPADCNNAGLIPQSALPASAQSDRNDGFADITGDSWGIGYNFGILFAPTNQSRAGFSYRSKIKHKLGGDADFRIASTVPNATSDPRFTGINLAFADTNATASITLPEQWALSSYQQLTKKWELLGEITYTKWSQIQELVIEFDNAYKGASVEDIKFRNTYRYAIGTNYKPNDRFTYRLGFAFDEGAAPNATYRTPRIPDHDRKWLALGFGYKQNNISFDVGYARLFIDDAYINRTGSQGDTLNGKYQLSVDILSAQFGYAF
ncbi:MAG: outer membrane protein transport protein [Gammaproteobacteria bacterium]|jgi:long-chain fatty acid transport protein